MTETYNTTSDTLEIGFIFNHSIHGGRYLRIIRERNGSQENQQILLKPCFSEFTTNASFYNESLITVSCQHSSFNYSNSPIRIKIEDGTEFGACSKMSCFGCKRLPDGIQCMVPYIPGKAIQCILDGAVYNIRAPDIATTALTSETTETISTTLQGTSKDTTYMTQDTSYTSPEIELPTTSTKNLDIGRVTSTEKSTNLQNVTTIPESSATSSKIITTTVENSSMSREQNVTTPLTKGSSTSKSIITTDNLPGSLNITTEYPNSLLTEQDTVSFSEGPSTSKSIKSTDNLPGSSNITTEYPISLSTEQDIAMFTEGQSTSNSITSTDNLTGSLNMTTESTNSLPTEQRIVTSTEDSKISVETIGSRRVNEETTTEYLETTVKPTNASSNGAITIINQNIIDQGFCHKQDVNIQLYINCGIPFSATITVAIVTSKYETNPNTILTCMRSNDSTWNCPRFDIMTGKLNSSSGILDINFKFNFTIHAGYYVRLTSSCDGNQESKHIHLIPCFSGFTVNATFYNATSFVIICQHTSFNDSSSPIRIKLKGGNDLGACSKISCNSCKRLRDGIQCYVLYDPESIYQCVLDGAIYNISLPTTQPEIPTTTPRNVSSSQTVTTASENTTVSEKSVLSSTDSSSTTSHRLLTSSEGSTAYTLFTKTSSEGTIVETFNLTLIDNSQATFSKDHLTTESTGPGEISTSQDDIESSSTSRENVESTTSAPHFESTSIQSTKTITTAPRDVSEFNVQSSFFNDTSVIINCQHTSFNYSSSVIRIKSEGGDDYGSCFKTMCNGCKRLPEGIQCIVPYTPGKILQCIFDGTVYNISIPANQVTQTTLPGTTTTSERTTAISEYHSSLTTSMTSKIRESSTTQTFTSPARLSTEQSLTTGLTDLTTEHIFRTTESQNSLTSRNITPSTPDISSTSPIITTTSPSEIKTSPNVMLTSSSIFSTSKRNTVMTTLPGTQTSGGSALISTLKPIDVSEFTVNVTFHNESFINARCQHSSFNYTSSTIRIKVKGGNDYGACSRYSCNGCASMK
ncbi:mucin-3A-like [Crassostrea angulata]|uniref:mucin-3A-like n=1 Tax=Magallana angulata TaxID=2784310 RepID=UPI0022B0B458|nr:mucin-3A-like [Crassostrea angulata]